MDKPTVTERNGIVGVSAQQWPSMKKLDEMKKRYARKLSAFGKSEDAEVRDLLFKLYGELECDHMEEQLMWAHMVLDLKKELEEIMEEIHKTVPPSYMWHCNDNARTESTPCEPTPGTIHDTITVEVWGQKYAIDVTVSDGKESFWVRTAEGAEVMGPGAQDERTANDVITTILYHASRIRLEKDMAYTKHRMKKEFDIVKYHVYRTGPPASAVLRLENKEAIYFMDIVAEGYPKCKGRGDKSPRVQYKFKLSKLGTDGIIVPRKYGVNLSSNDVYHVIKDMAREAQGQNLTRRLQDIVQGIIDKF